MVRALFLAVLVGAAAYLLIIRPRLVVKLLARMRYAMASSSARGRVEVPTWVSYYLWGPAVDEPPATGKALEAWVRLAGFLLLVVPVVIIVMVLATGP